MTSRPLIARLSALSMLGLLAAPAAHANSVEDKLSFAIQAIASGDFPTAKDLLTQAEAEAPTQANVVQSYTLAGIFYYQGVMEFFAGDKDEAALTWWRKALEKDLYYSWDSGLVADQQAQALFEALRSEVDSRSLITVSPPDGVTAWVDGAQVSSNLEIVGGTHLIQVRCPDETLVGSWAVFGDAPDFRASCPDLAPAEEEPAEDDGDKKKKKKDKKKKKKKDKGKDKDKDKDEDEDAEG